jgi:hypothetical protein
MKRWTTTWAVAAVLGLVIPVVGQLAAGTDRAVAAPAAAMFTSLAPARILDTRIGLGAPAAAVAADGTIELQVTGAGGVPAGATAVALNVTATNAAGAGYVSAWPAGTARPTVSNLNLESAGATVANLVIVALPPSGRVALYTQAGADLVADVSGYWRDAPGGASTGGRFVSLRPFRLLDTRDGTGAPQGLPGAGGIVTFTVAGRGGVPATGAQAAVLVVTATDAVQPGYVTAWPAGTAQPVASVLNLKQVNDTVPNLVLMPLGQDGNVSLFTQRGANLIADVVGWVTDSTMPSSSNGLFVPLAPVRLLDSRLGIGFGKLWPGQRNDLVVIGHGGVPATGVSAVFANLTSTAAVAPGYVTAWPAVTTQPLASNLNAPGAGATVASEAFVGLGTTGAFSLFSQAGTHVVGDIAGYFIGTPLPADPGVPAIPPPPPAPPLMSRPPTAGAGRFACNAGPAMDQIVRVEVNPGLKTYLDNIGSYHTMGEIDAVAYTFMANSGPLPARVALDPFFDVTINLTLQVALSLGGPLTIDRGFFMTLLNGAYHETIHDLQAGTCALTGPTTGYPTPRIGFPQSQIFDDVNARIDAIEPLSGSNESYPHEVASTYLNPSDDIAAQGFESQLWEINAYVLAAEWGAGVNDTFGVSYLGDTAGNDDTMSAKFHQLARYLNRAQSIPAIWNALRTSPTVMRDVTEHWNLGVRSWQVYKQPLRDPAMYWDLAFGPDVGPIAAFTDGAAGSVAPQRPPNDPPQLTGPTDPTDPTVVESFGWIDGYSHSDKHQSRG